MNINKNGISLEIEAAIILLVVSVLYAVTVSNGLFIAGLILKPIPVFLFSIITWSNSRYNRYLSIGFILSGFGDIFLSDYLNMFIPGLSSFLIAHILFIIGFLHRNRDFKIIQASISYIFSAIVLLLLASYLGDMLIPVAFYVFVIFTMVWRASTQINIDSRAVWALVGAIIFVISDIVIAVDKFIFKSPILIIINMSTYWIAQYLIFLSRDRKTETLYESCITDENLEFR